MKVSITNNVVVQGSRKTPLVDMAKGDLFIDNAFITDVSYTKYLLPVISVIDVVRRIFK